MPLAVLDIELCALDAISSGLIAALALPVAILLTHLALDELVLYTVCHDNLADSSFESIALLA